MAEPAMEKPGLQLAEQEEYIELMPAEKKLIAWSLGIGIGLLIILIGITRGMV